MQKNHNPSPCRPLMDIEIELKLFASGELESFVETTLLNYIQNRWQVTVERSKKTLFNQYYDTPERDFRRMDMGLRVRRQEGHSEMTIKTSGAVVGGLHSRPEYNVDLHTPAPQLALFPQHIWPSSVNLNDLQQTLTELFCTDFTRHQYDLQFANGTQIELVCDCGKITVGRQSQAINEIELELKAGNPAQLFELASAIAKHLPVSVGNLSKAARGYMLVNGQELNFKELIAFLPINYDTDCENAFCTAVEYALDFWQHHEQCYLADERAKSLSQMHKGMVLLLQTLTLYLPLLQCDALLSLHKQLIEQLDEWFWLEDYLSLKELRSRKGPFRKKLGKHEEMLIYLRGCSQGLLTQHQPATKIQSADNVSLQLAFSQLLLEKPWRKESSSYKTPVAEHAKGWLSQGWHNVMQSMPRSKSLTSQEYVSQQSMLRQTMYSGFLLGNLFSERRDQFRAPWLDILGGVEELKTLELLKQHLLLLDLEDRDDLIAWCEGKIKSLLAVMEQSRNVAMNLEAYW